MKRQDVHELACKHCAVAKHILLSREKRALKNTVNPSIEVYHCRIIIPVRLLQNSYPCHHRLLLRFMDPYQPIRPCEYCIILSSDSFNSNDKV